LVTVVTAPSHTAVDEAMEDVANRWAAFHDASGDLEETAFVRVLSGARAEIDLPNVEYRNYYDRGDVGRVAELLTPHVTHDSESKPEHVVLFTTTGSLRGRRQIG
jgi:hypothetical protein